MKSRTLTSLLIFGLMVLATASCKPPGGGKDDEEKKKQEEEKKEKEEEEDEEDGEGEKNKKNNRNKQGQNGPRGAPQPQQASSDLVNALEALRRNPPPPEIPESTVRVAPPSIAPSIVNPAPVVEPLAVPPDLIPTTFTGHRF